MHTKYLTFPNFAKCYACRQLVWSRFIWRTVDNGHCNFFTGSLRICSDIKDQRNHARGSQKIWNDWRNNRSSGRLLHAIMVRQLLSLYISSVIIKGFVANSSSSSAEVWTPVLGTNLIVGETSRVRTTRFSCALRFNAVKYAWNFRAWGKRGHK